MIINNNHSLFEINYSQFEVKKEEFTKEIKYPKENLIESTNFKSSRF